MADTADASVPVRRASLVVAGRPVARHQVEVATALRCRAVVCLVDAPSAELTLLRAEVENAGARFDIARDAADLRALCGADDELLVIADGLLADPATSAELLRADTGVSGNVAPGSVVSASVVLVQPAESTIPLGFERLDLTRAAGGMMLIPGGLLADVPDGYDVPSALTRVALQAGVPTREVPDDARRGGRWRLVRGEAEARAIDDEWIAFNLGEGRVASPSVALARLGIRRFGSSLLTAGNGSTMLALGCAALLLLALAAGWLVSPVLAFAIIVMSSVVGQGGLLLLRVERAAASRQTGPQLIATALDVLTDAALLLLMIWSAPTIPGEMLTGRAFAPLMLIGFVRLGSHLYAPRYARWFADRAVVALALLVAAALDALPAGVELLALALAFGASIHLALGPERRI